MLNKLKLFFFFLSFTPVIAFADVCAGAENASANTTILFVNGIMNNSTASQASAKALSTSLLSNGFDLSKVNIHCYFNGTDGAYDDVIELRIQAAISSKAKTNDLTNTADGYYDRLGFAYRALSDKNVRCEDYLQYTDQFIASAAQRGTEYYENKYGGSACTRVITGTKSLANSLKKFADRGNVIVVAHSQGNFFLESAYAFLKDQKYTNLNRIQGVGVAAISQYPVNSRYLTIQQDNAIYFLQPLNAGYIKNLNYAPAIANSIACAQNLQCTREIGKGQNSLVLASVTGSQQAPSDILANVSAYSGISIPDDKRALMHEFVEVYLNEKVLDTDSGKRLPKKISEMVEDAYKKLNEAQPAIITTPLYGRYTSGSGEQCYERGIGTVKSTGIYNLSYSDYCLRGGKWVDATGVDNERYLDSQGNLYPFSSVEIKDTGNNTYTAGFAGSTIWNLTFTQKSAGVYSQSVKSVADFYSVHFDPNSYIYQNVGTLNLLISQYHTFQTNTGYLSSGGNIGFLFTGLNVTSGTVNYFNISDPNRNIVDTGTWSKKSFGSNTDIIELDEKSSILNDGDAYMRKIFYKNTAESGVREGNKLVAGQTETWEVFDRTTFNAMLARDGLPATPN